MGRAEELGKVETEDVGNTARNIGKGCMQRMHGKRCLAVFTKLTPAMKKILGRKTESFGYGMAAAPGGLYFRAPSK
jgi:hypothetical protein